MPATIRSPPRVPAGRLIVRVSAEPFWSTKEAARNAMAANAGDAAQTNPATTTINVASKRITGSERKNIVNRAWIVFRASRARLLRLMLLVLCEGYATHLRSGTI